MSFNKLISVLLLALFIHPFSAKCQREMTKTVTVEGSYVASENETPAYGHAQALWNAKKEALRAAGVTEDISSTTIIVLGGTGSEFKEICSELGRLELAGRVRVKEQQDKTPQFTDNHLIRYSTVIRADVVLEEAKEDLFFKFECNGIRNAYRSGEKMAFTVTAKKECYLRIFYFGKTASDNAQLFPMEGVFRDVPLKADVPVAFPPEESRYLYKDAPFDYTMETSVGDGVEQGVVLIVALKKNYPFTGDVTYERVINWWSKIPRDEKQWEWHGVNIVPDN